jgi:hypothetical protein
MSRWITSKERSLEPLSRTFVLWAAVAVVPWVLLVSLVIRYGMDVPLLDHWSYIPLIERSYTGTLTLRDLWTQYYEHRLVFPRIVMLSLAHLTAWNTKYELATSLLLATAFFFVVAGIFRRVLGRAAASLPVWLLALLSLLVFSLSQWENWLVGGQFQMFLNILGVGLGVAHLTRDSTGWKEVAIAAAAGILATYSFGNGLLFWPIGLGILLLVPRTAVPRRRLVLCWILVSAAVCGSYLIGLRGDPARTTLASVLQRPFDYLRYFATYLGSPLASFSGSAWPPRDTGIAALVGAAGLVALFLAARQEIRARGTGALRRLAPFLGLAAYAIGSGLLAARSRLHHGIPQAFAPRYTTFSNLFWIGLVGVLALRSAEPGSGRRWRWALGAIGALILASSLHSIPQFRGRWLILTPARAEMVRGQNVELLKRLHPEMEQVKPGLVALRRLRLSVFRDVETERKLVQSAPHPLERFGQILQPLFRPEAMRVGSPVTIPVRITNPTTETWSAAGDGTGVLSVRLSYRWLDIGGRAIVVDGLRTLLPGDLGPGESLVVDAKVAPPDMPGRYVLRLSLVQEAVAWFDAESGGASEMEIDVLP